MSVNLMSAIFETEFFAPAKARRILLLGQIAANQLDATELPKDVLTTLLSNQDNLSLPNDTVLREIAYFPWVGSHSTSGAFVNLMDHIFHWLEAHPSVEKVNYAALTSSPWNKLAQQYAPKGPGAVLSFELKGGVEAGKKFVESLKLFSHVANIGDVRSLVIHPATTTHSQLSADEQLAAGVTPGLVRLSLGLENIDDLKADLEIGFAAAK